MSKRKSIKFCLLILTFLLIFIGGCGEDGTAPNTENPGQSGDPANGGKTPSDQTLRDGVDERNLPGLGVIGDTATLTVYLADRYGRYSVLPNGLNVHVATENGIATNTDVASADDEGKVTFTLRTQGEPEDVGEASWVSTGTNNLKSLLNGYAWFDGVAPDTNGYPGKGRVSVLYYTRGEEDYVDANGNGTRDSGETFSDTPVDPFVDYNSNGQWDTGENYVDSDGNGAYTGANGQWDNSKEIFRNTTMLVTSAPRIGISTATPTVTDGGTMNLTIVVCDRNYNRISSGSTIAVAAADGLALSAGQESVTLPADATVGTSGPTQLALIANAATFTHTAGSASPTITVTVTWNKGSATDTYTYKFPVTVN